MLRPFKEALALHQQGKLHEAAAIYQERLRVSPDEFNSLHMLGVVALQSGDYEKSVQLISRSLELQPLESAAHHNLGSSLRVLGKFTEARAHYERAIALKPAYPEAYFNLSAVRRFQVGEPFITKVEEQLETAGLSKADRVFLHFAAGKYYDDTGDYDRAFAHFRQGNEAKGAVFNKRAYAEFLSSSIEVVDQELVSHHRNSGFADQTPILIVGMPRSGTTLVEQVLSAHSQIHGAGELPDIASISKSLKQHAKGVDYPRNLRTVTGEVFSGFGKSYANRLKNLGGGAARVVDKNPINHQHLALACLMLRGVHILHCYRNPMDTVLSCYFQNFRGGQEFSYSFSDLASYYHGYRQYMAHWKSLFPDRILDVAYEDVVNDLEGQARRILEFCELSFEKNCLEFHKTQRAVSTASDIQVRQPIYRNSMERWRRYEKHLGELVELMK